jgi:serine/threonine protein kinase/Flp pilus assembly protein TadD
VIGKTISHYVILEKLGEGGMGVVYKAEDSKLKRTVALKFLPHQLATTDQDKERFLQEARAASALNHPNVCTIYDIQEFDGQTFIVMEYVEGKTLREAKQGLGVSNVVAIAAQIAEGLAAAHEKGIVHRDIKADNVMLRSDGRAQIMDFGLAKFQGVSALTKAGSTVGTMAYMSPEQIQGDEADHRADIFALGVLMYELLTGRLPFNGAHEAAVMYEIVNVDPVPVGTAKPGVEADLERIVTKCLEKRREDRYQSVREVAVDLKRFKRDSEGQPLHSPLGVQAAQSTKKTQSWIGLAILVLVVVGGVIAWFLLRGKGDVLDSLAVLPFENAGNDPSMEYLSDGISESIINSLTRIPELRVVPRSTAFRLRGIDPQDAGLKLNVRAVLAGRITQRGDGLNVQVDLVDVETQSQLWGQQYRSNTKDLMSLQDEITSEVSNRLRLGISGETKERVTKRYTDNPEAYKLYLQGRYFWNKRRASEIQRAIESFNNALALDPNYALAYVGLADSYILLEQYAGIPGKEVYPKAVVAATRALEIDNSLAEAHTTLAFANCASWNWEKSEQGFKYAISLNPNYPTTYHWYSILLNALTRHDDAFTAIKQAQVLDPLSPVIAVNVAIAYYLQGNYQRALQELDGVLRIDSSFSPAYIRKGECYAQMGRVKEGYAASLKGVETSGRSAEALSFLGYSAALLGKRDEAVGIANELEQRFSNGTSSGYYIARVYLGLGEGDKAFRWLNADFENHAGTMIWLTQDKEWDSYRTDPRFVDLLKKIGLAK